MGDAFVDDVVDPAGGGGGGNKLGEEAVKCNIQIIKTSPTPEPDDAAEAKTTPTSLVSSASSPSSSPSSSASSSPSSTPVAGFPASASSPAPSFLSSPLGFLRAQIRDVYVSF